MVVSVLGRLVFVVLVPVLVLGWLVLVPVLATRTST